MWEKACLYSIHGIFMAIGWLILIPAGIWMSTIGKHRYPLAWVKYHAIIQGTAAILILSAATLALWITTPHFDTFHGVLGPCLNVLLVTQLVSGIILRNVRVGGHRPCIAKAHKAQGLLLYIGGLVNGSLGIHDYSMTIKSPSLLYSIAMMVGAMLMAQIWFVCQILPVWYGHWTNDQAPPTGQ